MVMTIAIIITERINVILVSDFYLRLQPPSNPKSPIQYLFQEKPVHISLIADIVDDKIASI